MVNINKNIPKSLIVNLIYPAVLGSIIYYLFNVIVSSIVKGDEIVFLKNDLLTFIYKLILIIEVIGFYCCDYLYSMFTKDFKVKYFIYNIFILSGVAVTFLSINTDSTSKPKIELILLSFIAFMLLYLLWDFPEIKKCVIKNLKDEEAFYRKIVKWEVFWVIVFIILFVINIFISQSYCYILPLMLIGILISTIRFALLVSNKRDFIE